MGEPLSRAVHIAYLFIAREYLTFWRSAVRALKFGSGAPVAL